MNEIYAVASPEIFDKGVRQSVAFPPIHPCSAALPGRPCNQKTSW